MAVKKGKNMDINNIPNEFYKEIIDKDGQKIIFDFKDLYKSKKEYIRLTQDEYGKLKEYATKRKKVNKIDGILGIILLVLGIRALFYTHSWWSLLILAISLVFMAQSTTDYSTSLSIYGYVYGDVKKYADVGMSTSDIISILILEKEFRIISEIADIDTESASKIEVNKDLIDFLYVDSSKIPHTKLFNLKGMDVYYKNIDDILMRDETVRLSVILPLKYSDRYKKLVD